MSKLFAPLAFLLIGCIQAATAGENLWTTNGPPGAFVYDVAYLDDTGVAVALTAKAIFRTTNHGASWTQSRLLGTFYPGYLTVNPANRNQVVVFADTVWRSVDGGATFNTSGGSPGDLAGVQSLAFGADGTLWAGYYAGFLRRSADAGSTWVFVGAPHNGVPNPVQVMTDATNGNVIYAFTQNGPFRSDDRGVTWIPLPANPALSQFSASRGTSGTLFAHRTTDYQAFRSLDFGATWAPIGTTPVSWITSASGSPARLLAVTNDIHATTSPDNGTTWNDLGRFPNAIPTAISFGPGDANRILLATGAGVIATSDGGATWDERNIGMNQAVATALLPPVIGSNALQVVTADLQSIYRRDSATGNWTGIARTSTPVLGYPGNSVGGYQVAIAPSDANTLYMARDGNFGRSIDGGTTWSRRSSVPALTNRIAVNPANPQVVYLGVRAVMFNEPSLFKSVDGGQNWAPLNLGISDAVSIAIDPQQPNTVYALSSGQGFNAGLPVSRSVDGGATWAFTGWQASSNYQAHAFVLDPSTPSTIYIGLDNSMYRSTDSGATWTLLSPFVIASTGVRHIVIDPQSPEILYVIGAHGANYARSVDRGATWEPLRNDSGEDLSIVSLNSMAVAPGHNARLIGARAGAGLQEFDVTPWVGLTKSATAMTAGTLSTVTLTVTNAGLLSATRARVTGTLASATDAYAVTSTGATCNVVVREMTCEIGVLRPAATLTIDVRFTPTSAGTWNAALSAYEPLTGGLTQMVTVSAPPAPPAQPGPPASPSGGGGGGRFDYLLVALLGVLTMRGAIRRR